MMSATVSNVDAISQPLVAWAGTNIRAIVPKSAASGLRPEPHQGSGREERTDALGRVRVKPRRLPLASRRRSSWWRYEWRTGHGRTQTSAQVRRHFQCLHEFIPAARRKLSDHIWGSLVGAAESETTMRRNRMAIDSLALRPRVCVDVSKIDATTSLFGKPWRLPVFLFRSALSNSFDPGGAATAGRAASAFGTPIMCSSVTHPGLEEIAAATPGRNFPALRARRQSLGRRRGEARGRQRL